MDTVGSRIKLLRKPNSQDWLAAQLGIPKGTLSNYESGKSELNFAVLKAITAFFNVTSDWLLFGIGPQYRGGIGETQGTPQSNGYCSGCVALECILAQEREERQALAKENKELNFQIGQLTERLKPLGGGGDANAGDAEARIA